MQPTLPAPSAPGAPEAPAAPPAPEAPSAVGGPPGAAVPSANVVATGPLVGARAMPRTGNELAAIRQQRKWLSDQLVSSQERRSQVARALENARDPANRAGLEQRLQTLDRRIVQLETDISETGRLLTSAPASAVIGATSSSTDDGSPGQTVSGEVVGIVFILAVLLPIVLTLCARFLRRSRPAAADPMQRESAARLVRLEQAVDAIAVEVERVSEGQRFVTRLLADAQHQTAEAPALREYRPN